MKKLIFDGGMGTCLQAKGLAGDPVEMNLTHGAEIIDIHRQYLAAGADVITANTFGAYVSKYPNAEKMIEAAIGHARTAGAKTVALDMGPTGKMMEPFGDMTPEEAEAEFSASAQAGKKYGADMILIETFFCLYELEAAVKAVKVTGLPVVATMTFDKKGRTTMGVSLSAMVELLAELGVDALGMNCGLGPDVYKDLLPDLLKATTLPVLVQPNAGLPESIDGKTVYTTTPADFAKVMAEINAGGCTHLGGCCGTTPAHISAMVTACGLK